MVRGSMSKSANGAKNGKNGNGGPLGIEATLWIAADALRKTMDAAEYKHISQSEKFIEARSGKLGATSRSTAKGPTTRLGVSPK